MEQLPPSVRGGTNLEHARSHNRRAVVDAIRRGGAMPRAAIAALTGLAPQTVSNIAAELLEAGVLRSEARIRRGRGQPAIPLRIDPAGGYGIGVELSPRRADGAMVDLDGTIVARKSLPLARSDPAHVLPAIETLARHFLGEVPRASDRLLGLGVALPGPFGVEPLASSTTTLEGWFEPPSTRQIADRLGAPVFLEHDAGAAAIGERYYGAARTLNDFLYLYVSTGLGAGLFVDGRPYKGRMGNAGEVGHLSVDPNGEPCSCGNRGCLERYLSVVSAREHIPAIATAPDVGTAVSALLAQEDPAAVEWARAAGLALGRAVAALENIFDPETIVLGGTMPMDLLARVVAAARPLPASVADRRERQHPRILIGACGSGTAALGAACLPIFDRFNPSFDALMKRRGLRP